jgi:cytochrome c oxidase assembly protein subunit 15
MGAEAHAEPHAARLARRELTASRFRKLALASAVSLYVIVTSGATVRLTGSGLGCEGWPGCSPGAVFPEKDYHSFVEFGNRLVSVFPILLSLATATASVFVHGLPRWAKVTAWGAALGTLAQAPLGLITVRLDLDPVAVMAHFLLAIVVLAGAIVVVLEARRLEVGAVEPLVPSWARWAGLGFAALALALVVSGTVVTAAGPHAGDPDVVDRLWQLDHAVWLHVRVTAVFGIALLGVLWYLRRTPLIRVGLILLGLVLAQMIVGEIQWRSSLPWWLVLVHVTLATGIWAATVWLVTLLWRPSAAAARA